MALDIEFTHLMEQHQALLRQFVTTELDLAVTFCERALTAYQPYQAGRPAVQQDVFSRNADNARTAYESAMRAMEHSDENLLEDSEITSRMLKLRPLLAELKQG